MLSINLNKKIPNLINVKYFYYKYFYYIITLSHFSIT